MWREAFIAAAFKALFSKRTFAVVRSLLPVFVFLLFIALGANTAACYSLSSTSDEFSECIDDTFKSAFDVFEGVAEVSPTEFDTEK